MPLSRGLKFLARVASPLGQEFLPLGLRILFLPSPLVENPIFLRFLVIAKRAVISYIGYTTRAIIEITARVVDHPGNNRNYCPGGQKLRETKTRVKEVFFREIALLAITNS